jgi:hypothetical protein
MLTAGMGPEEPKIGERKFAERTIKGILRAGARLPYNDMLDLFSSAKESLPRAGGMAYKLECHRKSCMLEVLCAAFDREIVAVSRKEAGADKVAIPLSDEHYRAIAVACGGEEELDQLVASLKDSKAELVLTARAAGVAVGHNPPQKRPSIRPPADGGKSAGSMQEQAARAAEEQTPGLRVQQRVVGSPDGAYGFHSKPRLERGARRKG